MLSLRGPSADRKAGQSLGAWHVATAQGSWLGLCLASLTGLMVVIQVSEVPAPPRDPRLETAAALSRAAERELAGHSAEAEQLLVTAARRDRRFVTAYATASFYHRQHNLTQFQAWAPEAARLSYGDRSGLFQLLSVASLPPRAVDEIVPPPLRAEYAAFLLSRGLLPEADRILPPANPTWGPVLTERWLERGNGQAAVESWNRCCVPRLRPEYPQLVNAALLDAPRGLGFDWRLSNVRQAQTHAVLAGAARGYFESVLQAGAAPVEILSQYILLAPEHTYDLTFELQSQHRRGPALRASVEILPDRRDCLADTQAVVAETSWSRHRLTFQTPRGLPGDSTPVFARLSFQAATPGNTSLRLRDIWLEFAR